MGQGSSQPVDIKSEFLEEPHDFNMQTAQSQSSPPSTLKKLKDELQRAGADKTLPQRKRKSSHDNDGPGSSAASPEHRSPPSKRNRLVDSLEKNVRAGGTKIADSSKGPTEEKKARKSESRAPSLRTPGRPLSTGVDRNFSMSPALSVGDSQTKGRLKRSNGSTNARGATGAFKPDEVETLEAFKIDFCNTNGCSTVTFDLMVQHGMDGPWPGQQWIAKKKFWKTVHTLLPDRDRRSVYRFMKRHFQGSDQKPHEWTEEQEDELVELYKKHGPKWTLLAELLGRSSDDVVQRWKNRLEHRGTMNTGSWTEEELSALQNALRSSWTKLKEEGYDVGENIYEMDESLISWTVVSANMQHRRSRQQCADKWRRIKGRFARGPLSQPNSRSVTPTSTSRAGSRGRESQSQAAFKSATYVDSDGEGSDTQEHGPDGGAKLKSAKKSPGKSTLADGEATDGSDSDSPSESSSEDESEPSTQSNPKGADSKHGAVSDTEADSRRPGGPDQQREGPKITYVPVKKEPSNSSSDSSSDSSEKESESESEGESESESESESEKPASKPESAKSTADSEIQLTKIKRERSPPQEAEKTDAKRLKVEEPPNPARLEASETSESDSETSSESDSESDSAGSSNGDTKPQPEGLLQETDHLKRSTMSTSDTDSDESSSDSE
ncbi:hypothetical protein BJX61DRAFT_390032 [Aspergillus egyptiacus]|nr:hypothetical protein BJX61DRAFT_390032 [Aspergillus egyptiacus]